jgi:flagellar biosynthesis/type III secretory pathway chaperone
MAELDSVAMDEVLTRMEKRLADLEDLLEREQTLLGQRDAEPLEQVAAEKIDALGGLEKLERERRALLAAAGTDGMGPRSDESPVTGKWRALSERLARVRLQNERNGLAIQRRAEQVRTLLSIVHGGSGDTSTPVYDAAGSTSSGDRGRILSRA